MAPDRVLIVDDQPLFREAFSAVIARVTPNATFVEAASHRELLMRLAGGEPFALLFLDLALLGANCFDELAKLRKRRPETATVVVSARSDWPTIQRAMACGIAGYIPKSSATATFENAIRSVLAGDSYVPSDGVAADPSPPCVTAPEPLTRRQVAVLEQLRYGRSNRQIAVDLGIEEITVKVHISAILRKLHVKNRLQAIVVTRDGVGGATE